MSAENVFKHMNGLPSIPDNNFFTLYFDKEKISLNLVSLGIMKNKILQSFEIPLNRIIEADFITEEYLKDKSVIKRAIVGSFIGPASAIVGAISGVGKKTVKKTLYSITYLSSDNEVKNIMFDPNPIQGVQIRAEKFNKELKKQMENVEKVEEIKKMMNIGFGNNDISENEDGSTVVKL